MSIAFIIRFWNTEILNYLIKVMLFFNRKNFSSACLNLNWYIYLYILADCLLSFLGLNELFHKTLHLNYLLIYLKFQLFCIFLRNVISCVIAWMRNDKCKNNTIKCTVLWKNLLRNLKQYIVHCGLINTWSKWPYTCFVKKFVKFLSITYYVFFVSNLSCRFRLCEK